MIVRTQLLIFSLRVGSPYLWHQTRGLLVAAFLGYECILEAYTEAIRERYRLFSYGDRMLVL